MSHTRAGSGVASCSVASGIEMLGYARTFDLLSAIDRGLNRTEALNVKGFEDFNGIDWCYERGSNAIPQAPKVSEVFGAWRGRTIASLRGAPAAPSRLGGRREKCKRIPARTMDRAESRE